MLKKIILISAASFFNKIFFIILPYLVDSKIYYDFNNSYFTASLLSMLIIFGFDFAYARFKISIKNFILILFINGLVFIPIFLFTKDSFFLFILILTIFNVFASVVSTYLLFEDRLIAYFNFSFASFILSIISVLLFIQLNIDLFALFTIFNTLLIISIIKLKKGVREEPISILEFYKLGLSIFLINSVAGIIFSVDKYIVNNYLPLDEANSFTFAWMSLIPLLYVGNIFEKFIYSNTKIKFERRRFYQISLLNSLALAGYILLVWLLFGSFNLLPKSINLQSYLIVFIPLSISLFLFASLHFPLNGYLFKHNSRRAQKFTAIFNIPVLLIAVISIFYLASVNLLSLNLIIIISFSSLIIINLMKGFFIYNEIKN